MVEFNNPEKQETFSPDEFLKELDRNWWENARKKIKMLEKHFGMQYEEMFEFLPPDIQKQYQNLHSPEIVDEENLFYLKTYKGKEGKSFKLTCNNSTYKNHRKMDKQTHNALKECVFSLSQEPTGSLLPERFGIKAIKREQRNFVQRQFSGSKNSSSNKLYQIKLVLNATDWRIIYDVDFTNKLISVLYVGKRDALNSILW